MKTKCIFLICSFMCITNLLFSQKYAVDKGAIIASGTAGFSYSSGKLYEINGQGLTTISLTPSFNYLVIPNLFIGASTSLTYMSLGSNNATTLGIGPQFGYYIGKEESSVFPYATAGFKYNMISSSGSSNTINGSDISFGLGVLVPMKSHIGLTIEALYHIQSISASGTSVSGNMLSIGIGLSGLFY
ncbi:MAG: outer membrane beta-barrel protein [Bacteroidia bacterium]